MKTSSASDLMLVTCLSKFIKKKWYDYETPWISYAIKRYPRLGCLVLAKACGHNQRVLDKHQYCPRKVLLYGGFESTPLMVFSKETTTSNLTVFRRLVNFSTWKS